MIGQKRPLLPRNVWSISVRLEMAGNTRNLVLFNMEVDSKVHRCDLEGLRVGYVSLAGRVKEREPIAAHLKRQCLPDMIQPVCIARVVLFLASDDAAICTTNSYMVEAGSI